ncbi:MAG: nodulation protein NfeD [Desulfuromonadales bacterium]
MRQLCYFILIISSALLLFVTATTAQDNESKPVVHQIRVESVINPVTADFATSALNAANEKQADAFLLQLDTPGGLDSSMRSIIQGILGSEIPVIVYVSPSGARAASAGALITLAADFAVMAPGTNIGAAHPVAIGMGGEQDETMMEKAVSDAVAYSRSIAQKRDRNEEWAERIVRESLSSSATEAMEKNVIDLIAESEASLFQALDGRHYQRAGVERELNIADATVSKSSMNWRQKVLDTISNPTVAYLLMMLGILGIFFEISQPGGILPGAVGVIALLLAFFAFQMLPVNYVGVLFIVLAVILFVLEIKVTSFGMLTVGGVVALALGSLMLIETSEPYLQISRAVIAATVLVFSGLAMLVLYFVVGTQKTKFASGEEGILGERGQAVSDIDPEGQVYVHGEYWSASSRDTIAAGEPIEVVNVDRNMRLQVRKSIEE